MKRPLAICALALVLLGVSPTASLAATPSAVQPDQRSGSGPTCTGGDRTGPSIGAWLRQVQPAAIALLDASTVGFLNGVYSGTICRTATTATVAQPVPGVAIDPSGSNPTSPYGACNPPSGGCVTAMTIFNNTIGFGSSQYSGEVSIELDAYDGATGSWNVTATNFNNNHGSSWGMNPTTGLHTYPDHNGYWMDAFRADAFWQWLDANPATTALNLSGERVHLGAQGTLSIQFVSGLTASGSYCYFGEYDFAGSNAGGGWCATP